MIKTNIFPLTSYGSSKVQIECWSISNHIFINWFLCLFEPQNIDRHPFLKEKQIRTKEREMMRIDLHNNNHSSKKVDAINAYREIHYRYWDLKFVISSQKGTSVMLN